MTTTTTADQFLNIIKRLERAADCSLLDLSAIKSKINKGSYLTNDRFVYDMRSFINKISQLPDLSPNNNFKSMHCMLEFDFIWNDYIKNPEAYSKVSFTWKKQAIMWKKTQKTLAGPQRNEKKLLDHSSRYHPYDNKTHNSSSASLSNGTSSSPSSSSLSNGTSSSPSSPSLSNGEKELALEILKLENNINKKEKDAKSLSLTKKEDENDVVVKEDKKNNDRKERNKISADNIISESRVKQQRKEKKDEKEKIIATKKENTDDTYNATICQVCDKGSFAKWMLLCDNCDKGYHIWCCTPQLFYIPESDWYCHECEKKGFINLVDKRNQESPKQKEQKEKKQQKKEKEEPKKEKEKQKKGKEEPKEEKEKLIDQSNYEFSEEEMEKMVTKINNNPEKYETYTKDGSDWDKQQINKLYIDILKTIKIKGHEIHLDGPDLNTTKMIQKHLGTNFFHTVFVPNSFSYQQLKKTAAEQKDLKVDITNMLARQLLFRFMEDNISAMWLDYCCSMQGNDMAKPKSDIRYVFQNKLMKKGSVFGVTLAFRTGQHADYKHQSMNEMYQLINQLVNDNGYSIETPHFRFYHLMFVIFVKLKN